MGGGLASAHASDRAGRYEIQSEIARGGMGVVYRALDRTTGKILALKRGLVERGETWALVSKMLEREYRMLVSLRHPYIIEVYDFGVDESGPYYTMELLDGADLRTRCPMPWREVCAHLRDVASSLALLHSRRLLHGDVSVANIRLTGEGGARLIDFGTVASFGRNTVIVGTPPTMAPEVVKAQELDQRADFYALGATAYYALTGRHAYPATTVALLPALWAQGRPPPPSAFASDIPPELDELVLSLLEHDRVLRPSSAAEVIDRLEVIAGLTPDQDPRVLRSYLHSTVAVGRAGPRQALSEKLKQALSGRAAGLLIEGAPGLGKSFLLNDLAQEARVAGVRVLTVHARAHSGDLAVWFAFLREAMAQSAGQIDPTLASSGSGDIALELVKEGPLLIAIEDLQEADTESLALLARWTKSAARFPLLFLATLDPSHPQAGRPAIELLRSRFGSLQLSLFDEKATHDFVVGLFGDVPAVGRLAQFLYDGAAGNPQAYRLLIDHLIEQGQIRYVGGSWVLPTELPVGPGGIDLAMLAEAAFKSMTAHWRAPLRRLAQCLSVSRRAFDLELCEALAAGESALAGQNTSRLIGELVSEGVLVDERGSYMFARRSDQKVLYSWLNDTQRQRHHLRLGEHLAKRFGGDMKRSFEIGFHFLCAGEVAKARRYLNKNVDVALRDPDMLIQSVPDLRAILKRQREAGASDDEVQFVEGMLVVAGFYIDPRVYDTHGERVVRTMHRTLGFALASRLAPFLGRHLALAAGMFVAWGRSLFRRHLVNGGSFASAVLTFAGVCASMNAGACVRLDRKVPRLLRELLDVTSQLGRFNALRFIYDQFLMSEDLIGGRIAQGFARLHDQLERLPRLPFVAGESAHQLRMGFLSGLAANSLLRLGSEVPALADQIEALGGRHDRLQAQAVRSLYYVFRGDLAAGRREEQRLDEMSAHFDSRWAADVCAAFAYAPYHLTADVLGLKRALHRMELLMPLAPGLVTAHKIARAMYEGHRGRPDLALGHYEELGDQIAPFAAPHWAVAAGHKAECLNALGRHAEALAFCEQMRVHLTEEDRAFVFIHQQLERESALALAGLGRLDEAAALSDKLLAEWGRGDNPLIRGLLHLDRARIARLAEDTLAFERHARAAKTALAATNNPAAIARATRLLDTRSASIIPEVAEILPGDSAVTFKERPSPTRRNKAVRVLDEIVPIVQARSAYLYLMASGRAVLCARHGAQPPDAKLTAELEKVASALHHERHGPAISRALDQIPAELSPAEKRLIPVVASAEQAHSQLVAVLVLGECERVEAIGELDLALFASELLQLDPETARMGEDDWGPNSSSPG